jgi:hypothetical protein
MRVKSADKRGRKEVVTYLSYTSDLRPVCFDSTGSSNMVVLVIWLFEGVAEEMEVVRKS